MKRKIVCLCGSTRFEAEYKLASKHETLKGNIVLSVGLFGHSEGLDMNGEVKRELDRLHIDKIDVADEILVIDGKLLTCDSCKQRCESGYLFSKCCNSTTSVKPYIGESTQREIIHAMATGKPIRYFSQECING